LTLQKTAVPEEVTLGQVPVYTYTVTNTSNATIDNINISDDNGTPADTSDDFIVNETPFSLAAGQSQSFDLQRISEELCMLVNGVSTDVGTLTVNVLPSGDVDVLFTQPWSINDNRYGTGATSATGWTKGHKFGDLTGSDEATFQFTDGLGAIVLSFQEDYISASTGVTFGDGMPITYPSGYGTLGPLGGDGKILVGSSANVLTAHTSLSDSINSAGFTTGFTVNSPPETFPLSGISIPPGWDYFDRYHVVVSHLAFGANGFGAVTVPLVHNSPSKNGIDKSMPTLICECVTNIAVATGSIRGNTVSATATETVCPSSGTGGGSCPIWAGAATTHDKQFKRSATNNGTTTATMTGLTVTWPSSNGTLNKVKLDGDVVWDKKSGAGVTTITIPNSDLTTDVHHKSIDPGKTRVFTLEFQNNAATDISSYSGTVSFGDSCTLSLQ
jgi:hypothetical protein